jgi:outer membrane murein-binding lipoprotein Lpp
VDYLNEGERAGEALLGLGLIAGGVRSAWRWLFPVKNGTGAPPLKASLDTLTCQVSTLSAKVASIDTKVDTVSEKLATLSGKLEGYIDGRRNGRT